MGLHFYAKISAQAAINKLNEILHLPHITVEEGVKKVIFKEEKDPLIAVETNKKKRLLCLAYYNLG